VADEGISIGDVHVDVSLRTMAGAWAKWAAENQAAANKLGDSLGDHIGKAIAARIGRGIRDGLDGAGVGTQGTRAGTEFGGRFADGLRARLTAALRNLPTPQIGAATTEAEQKVRDLRNSIDQLRARIGVDLDGAEALAEMRRLEVEARRLGAASPTIEVRTDALGAAAALAGVAREADNVGQAGTRASLGMRTLISAGIAIGPAIVPGAAAAVGAILAIGSAATSVLAGAGVGALAFRGVGGAVSALSAAQRDAAKTGATLASQQRSLAGGADQVRAAEAALANTRANASDALRRASQQVTDLRRAELQAERDLADARSREARSQQDLAQQVKGNALDQRQAVLDLAEARRRARPGVEADQVALEQAELRVENLRIAGQRLAQEKARNDKTGMEGSRAVQAAQQRVADAASAVKEAQAQQASTARQAAFQIQQASQAVITAQRGVGAATVAAGATGGAAMDALNEAMERLSPTGQRFARFLFGLKGNVDELKASAEGGILPGAQEAITILLPYFGDLNDFVADVSTTVGELEVRAAKTFTNPFWRQFFGFVASEATPNLVLMYEAGVNVAEGLARITLQFAPMQRQVGGGLLDLTERFADWSRGLDQNQGFQRFVRYAQTEGPRVVATIGELARAGLHIVEAYAPVGSVVVTGLRLLGQVINAIPVEVITALAFAITGYKAATLLAGIAQQGLNSNLLTGIGRMITYGTVTTAAGTSTTAFQRGASSLSKFIGGGPFALALGVGILALSHFADQSSKAKQQVADLRSAAERYGQILKDGVTPEAAQAASEVLRQNAALRGLVDITSQAGISTQTLVAGLNGDAKAREKVVAVLDRQIAAEKLKASEARGGGDADTVASKAHRDRATALEKMRAGFLGANAGAAEAIELARLLARVTDGGAGSIEAAGIALTGAGTSAADFSNGIAGIVALAGAAAPKVDALAVLSGRVAEANLSAAEKAGLFGEVLKGIGVSATTSGPAFDALAGTFGNIARSSLDAKDKVRLLEQAIQQMYGAAIDQVEVDEKLARTQADLTRQLNTSSAGFDLNKAKQRGNTLEVLANRDALEAALLAARDKYVQDLANGVAEDEARTRHQKTVKGIVDGIKPTRDQTGAVKELVEKYGQIPPKKTTDVSTPGLDKAIDDLIEAHAVQIGLSMKPPWNRDQIKSEIDFLKGTVNGQTGQSARFKATGGPVEGAGTGTSDDVPAYLPEAGTRYRLSAGEHILTAAEVEAAGGHGSIYALRKVIRGGGLKGAIPGFARGGAVGGNWPVEIPANVAFPVSLDSLWDAWRYATQQQGIGVADFGPGPGFPPWPSSPSASRGDSGVWRSIVALIKSTGPLSGTYGNGYRPGDPLWHGSGRGLDWMGYNQDALAAFLAARRPLELIHRTSKRDYAYTRGRDRGSFNNALMEAHRNHIHVAMHQGGHVGGALAEQFGIRTTPLHVGTYDSGGTLPPGLTLAYNGTGGVETVRTEQQEAALAAGATITVPVYGAPGQPVHELAKAVAAELAWQMR
jgi:hypothetical protein